MTANVADIRKIKGYAASNLPLHPERITVSDRHLPGDIGSVDTTEHTSIGLLR